MEATVNFQPGRGNPGNPFFSVPEGPEEPRKGRVYAAIEVPEEPEERGGRGELDEPVYLECIDTAWFEDVQRNYGEDDWLNLYRAAPLSVLELRDYPLPPFPEELQPGDIAWFEFGYSPAGEGEADARIYTSLYSTGAPAKISFHEPRRPGWARGGPCGTGGWLASLSLQSLEAEHFDAINEVLKVTRGDGGVAVYDVGQGACQAMLSGSHGGVPSLYIDFGGGVLGNAKTFPSGYRGFCFTQAPAILLSHWDWDHWSSAHRFPQALDTVWIAPPIPEKPIQQAFAADLHSTRKLLIWGKSAPQSVRRGSIRVERCSGKTVNDSGLAVTVYSGAGRSKNCLLPGDASYRHIPSVLGGESFNAVCITHHGGRLHSRLIPKPKRGARTVCSVGAGNSYKHPFIETLEAHELGGWPMPMTTGFSGSRPSHVLLPWNGGPKLFVGSCHGDFCSVAYVPE